MSAVRSMLGDRCGCMWAGWRVVCGCGTGKVRRCGPVWIAK